MHPAGRSQRTRLARLLACACQTRCLAGGGLVLGLLMALGSASTAFASQGQLGDVFAYEDQITGVWSSAGSHLTVVGRINVFDGAFADLHPFDPSLEFTFVITGLVSQGTHYDPNNSNYLTTDYAGGRFTMYQGSPRNAPTAAGGMPPSPPNSTVPSTFADGTVLLTGTVTTFQTSVPSSQDAGTVQSLFAIDGGTLASRIGTSLGCVPCGGVPTGIYAAWCVQQAWGCRPQGYSARATNGSLNLLDPQPPADGKMTGASPASGPVGTMFGLSGTSWFDHCRATTRIISPNGFVTELGPAPPYTCPHATCDLDFFTQYYWSCGANALGTYKAVVPGSPDTVLFEVTAPTGAPCLLSPISPDICYQWGSPDPIYSPPVFAWGAMPEADSYRVVLATDPTLASPFWTGSVDAPFTQLQYSGAPLDPGPDLGYPYPHPTYWWSAQTLLNGVWTPLANPLSFHVVAGAGPIIMTIMASAGMGGSITPSGAVSVTYGTNQTFAIVPDACYAIADVVVDGVSVGAVGTYTFPNVQANHTIAASFVRGGSGYPAAPTGLTVTNTGTSHSLDLKWDRSPSPGVTGYVIYRTHDGTTDAPIPVTGPAYPDDAPLTRNTTYTYRVVAVTVCGTSPLSASVSRAPDYFPVLLVHGICGKPSDFTDCPLGSNGRVDVSCVSTDRTKLGDGLVQLGITRVFAFSYDHDKPLNLVAPLLSQKITDILAQEGDPQLTLVAHSQGGLISRWAIQRIPGCSSKVADLIMLGTPNHGSEMARYVWGQPVVTGFLLPFWVFKFTEQLRCLSLDPARFDLMPGSWFLNQLNYRDNNPAYDSFTSLLLCPGHASEEVSSTTRYWILAGSGGWCGVPFGGSLGNAIGLCVPHDGVVSENNANLISVPSFRKAPDYGLDPGGAYNRATHFDGSEGSCNIEEVRHRILIGAVYNILTTGQIPSAPSAELLAAKPTSGGLMSVTESGADTIPQQIALNVSAITPGEARTDQVQVDDVLEVAFVQSWETAALTLAVRTPQGALITPADAGTGGVRYETDPTLGYQVLTIPNPSPGSWTVESRQSGGAAQGYSVEAYVRAGAKLVVDQPAETGQGGVVPFTASLHGASGPMPAVEISGLAHDPGGTATPIQFLDDGQHGDGSAGDGVFGGTFSGALAAGYYPVEINAVADAGGSSQISRRWVGGFLAQSRPDLSVVTNDVVVTRSRHGAPAESMLVTAKVHNLGSAAASGAVIAMAEEGHPSFTTTTVTLDPSGAATVSADWNHSGTDPVTLMVYVDSASPFGQARYDNDTARVVIQPGTVAVQPVPLPSAVSLSSAYPNPARGPVVIEFALPRAGAGRLGIYDVAGRLVRTVLDATLPAGKHSLRWDGRDNGGAPVASGMYFYELRFDGQRLGRRLVVLR